MSDRRQLLLESLATIERLEARLAASDAARHEPIAIVGAGCRYPGGVETPEELWRLLAAGRDAVGEIPSERWDADAYYDADPTAPGKMVTRRGGFLKQVDRFDPQFFGISPREAQSMDPQQRLLLETTYEALESAGIATDTLAGSATGVFVGITTSDYAHLSRRAGPDSADVYTATGSALNAAAGRISFTFGFQGPCVAVDTACSSSLVAVHLACQSLRAGESTLALAGGVNVILSPDAMVLFSKWGMMAPDGACKTFDAAADGFVRAEGCAVIALRRLTDALAAGDPILAIIRGSAVNSDGRSSGLTVPNGPAQQAVIRTALASAGMNGADIDYVEAHGTGTSLGDPIEVEALGSVLSAGRPATMPLRIGSVKTNLGHTEAASGLAGLLKVVLALQHDAIPAHLHFQVPNPGIPWADLPITVNTALTRWSRGSRPRRAGVSSFGFSGTNAHVILEEAPTPPPAVADTSAEPVPIPISARDEVALRAAAADLADFVAADPTVSPADIATTLTAGRNHHANRWAILADSTDQMVHDLRAMADGTPVPYAVQGVIRPRERAKIAFLFTGQGSQYPGMGRALYDTQPVFRATLDRAAQTLAPLMDRPLLDVLFGTDARALSQTSYTQPALFALEVALADLWRSWGVTPALVAGHSVGEYAAACVAGVFSLEEGLALIAERGRLMGALPDGGAMAAVFAPEACVVERISPWPDRLAIAAINGPQETVISGDADAVDEVLASLAADGVNGRRLEVSHAFHSPRLDPMLDAFERRAAATPHAAPRVPLVSNVTGTTFAAAMRPDASYWRRHAREAVRFAQCLETLRESGVTTVVEIGPHPTLVALAARMAPAATWTTVASLRRGRDDRREMLTAATTLHVRGAAIAWNTVLGSRGRRRALPTYPFQRQRYWVDATAAATTPAVAGHPLLGPRRDLANAPGTSVWERELGLATHPWITDHRVQDAAIVPATAYIEMALAAGRELFGVDALSVRRIENAKPLILHEGATVTLQTTVIADGECARFSVHSRAGAQAPWTTHVTAEIARTSTPATDGRAAVAEARGRCPRAVDGASFYAALAAKGNGWGPCFQGLAETWLGEAEAIARIVTAPAIGDTGAGYCFHPAVSDACGHALVSTVPLDGSTGAFVGGGVGEVRFYRRPSTTTLWAHARRRPDTSAGARVVTGDVTVYDDTGALVSETLDARLWYLDASDDCVYEVCWQAAALEGERVRPAGGGPWLILGEAGPLMDAIVAARGDERTVCVSSGQRFSLDATHATIRSDEPADLTRLIDELAPGAIVSLAGIDAPQTAAERTLHHLHGITGARRRAHARLWLVTRRARAAVHGDPCDAPWAACVWGLGRTLSVEHAELWGGLIDVEADGDAASLVREVETGTADDQIAYRHGVRFVPRLQPRRRRPGGRELVVRRDATHLVTGGLSGIGLAMAQWLVRRGARHLLLVSRSTASDARRAAVAALEAQGVTVEAAAIDVAVDDAVRRCLEARASRGLPPVRGVIHAAGILRFAPLASEDVAGLHASLAAKVDGAWQLHRLLESEPLDYFVLCSSSSAVLASPLLGSYAAGNAFLDALAHYRRARGLQALSVNWGTWGEVGMAVEAGRSAGGAMVAGMGTIATERGLAILSDLLESDSTQAAVMPVDWAKLGTAYPALLSDPFFALVMGDRRPATVASPRRAIGSADPAERPELLRTYLRRAAGRALGLSSDDLDPATPLSVFGFDSLMAVQLKNQIEAELGATVPMIQFLQGCSVDELTPTVLAALEAVEPDAFEATPEFAAEAWDEGSI